MQLVSAPVVHFRSWYTSKKLKLHLKCGISGLAKKPTLRRQLQMAQVSAYKVYFKHPNEVVNKHNALAIKNYEHGVQFRVKYTSFLRSPIPKI